MPKRTNQFQKIVACIFKAIALETSATVEESAILCEPDGAAREIDTLIEAKILGTTIRIAVECRHHRRKQDVEWIDELIGKFKHLDVDKIIAVSRTGFSKSALEKAAKSRIELVTPKQCVERDWNSELIKLGLAEIEVKCENSNVHLCLDPTFACKPPCELVDELPVRISTQDRTINVAQLRDEVIKNQIEPRVGRYIQDNRAGAKTFTELAKKLESLEPIICIENLRGVFLQVYGIEVEIKSLVFPVTFTTSVRKVPVEHLKFDKLGIVTMAEVFGTKVSIAQTPKTQKNETIM